MSAPAINPEPGYFSQPSTRLNIVQWLAPFVIAFVGLLINAYFVQQSQAKALNDVQTTIAGYQQIREERIKQLAVLESEAAQRTKDIEEIKSQLHDQSSDIKLLLQRSAR